MSINDAQARDIEERNTPLACPYCGHEAASNSALFDHVETAHAEEQARARALEAAAFEPQPQEAGGGGNATEPVCDCGADGDPTHDEECALIKSAQPFRVPMGEPAKEPAE